MKKFVIEHPLTTLIALFMILGFIEDILKIVMRRP
jgi:hypothetical protein